ncbi:MAG: phosphoglycolate phosphatase [Nitrosomonadaceae bacterium]|nr:phosphoglycolate phosphatase [Nitrosomonadaceae bacterium]|tara:strand:+ start:1766 stop:2494 length:729 start_codon:yes stop_codon:yes gene_type:complete
MDKSDFSQPVSSPLETKFPLTVKVIMIDLDGTLLDTAGDLAISANIMLRKLGGVELPLATIKSYIGKGILNLVRSCLANSFNNEPQPEFFDRAIKIYEKEYTKNLCITTRPYPKVIDGLIALKKADFRLACVTNKSEAFTLPLLRDTQLLNYFDIILSGDSLPKKKPDPMPLYHACEFFGILPAEMLLIGDSMTDIMAARAAGSYVFCVPYGYNEGKDVHELDCDKVISSIYDAIPLIKKSS